MACNLRPLLFDEAQQSIGFVACDCVSRPLVPPVLSHDIASSRLQDRLSQRKRLTSIATEPHNDPHRAAQAAGLISYLPPEPPREQKRWVYVPPDLHAKLTGQDTSLPLPCIGLAILIGRFVGGHAIIVSRKKRPRVPSKWRTLDVELEQLEGLDEIWVLCHRKPRPGWRLVGRFLAADVLALFCVYDKRHIGNDYGPYVQEIIEDWNRRFPGRDPHRGNAIASYLSGEWFDADQKEGG